MESRGTWEGGMGLKYSRKDRMRAASAYSGSKGLTSLRRGSA
jgi:hypothetical protein